MTNAIKVKNAYENNLKSISLDMPKNCICGICGVSGSGKSTLACEVIAKYALKAFALSMPVKLRRKLLDGKTPHVDRIENLSPVVLIDIKTANRSIRSTVATTSGLMTILRNMFSSEGKSVMEDSVKRIYPRLFSYNISEQEGGGACPYCDGTGKADEIQFESIINDEDKGILSGAFEVVNAKGIKYTKITDLFIQAACKQREIDVEKPLKKYTKEELDYVLFGSEQIISFTDRSGANGGKKALPFPGIIGALIDVYNRTQNANIGKFVTSGKCNACRGTRYNAKAVSYLIDGKNITDFLAMSISEANDNIIKLGQQEKDLFGGYAEEFSSISKELINIGVGYLTLDRAVSTLSGGELQRIKLAKQIAMNLEETCYVIDEPSSGLHDANIVSLMQSIKRLSNNHNTVFLVEHNPLILNACDFLIELGIGGGVNGGEIIAAGTPEEIASKGTLTGKVLVKNQQVPMRGGFSVKNKVGIYGVSVNNLKAANIEIPLNAFVSIAGVSGSGKSSAINTALCDAVSKYLESGEKKYNLSIDGKVTGLVRLDQNASVANSRSNVGTLLGVLDDIRAMYSGLEQSKILGYDTSEFSKNSKKGACEMCGGSGIVIDDDKNEEICDECNGTGYKSEILKVKYRGLDIAGFLALTIDELVNYVEDERILAVLNACQDIGLGYLSLDRKSPSLSKGEYQRIRLVTEICKSNNNQTIYVLDEPSKGLHYSDVDKIISTLKKIVAEGNTVIAIEHNLDMILNSDYVVEFGPGAGNCGGEIVFCGLVDDLCKANTKTAEAIKGYKITKESKKKDNTGRVIHIKNHKDEFVIQRNQINVLKGAIGSGKSQLLKKVLYANPLKRYVSSISNQGKYLTRDIQAEKNYGDSLPLTRLINVDVSVFGKHERIAETLNITQAIEKLYYEYGNHDNDVIRSSFNFAKRAGKCCSCGGNGRLLSYDFSLIMEDQTSEQALYDLLQERTRISRIAPLLKDEYGIDITKKYADMTYEERQIFLYGDKKKVVFYAPKKKEYWWDGCNTILYTNLSYASKTLQEKARGTYSLQKCEFCNGMGVKQNVFQSKYKGIEYREFLNKEVQELLDDMHQGATNPTQEEQIIIDVLEKMVEFGIGDIRLSDYTPDILAEKRMIVQYISYRMNPLANTMIAWDDFGMINDDRKTCVVKDLKDLVTKETTVLLVDNNLEMEGVNEIILGDFMPIGSVAKNDFSNVTLLTKNQLEKKFSTIDDVSARDSVGNRLGVIPLVRNEYKKKNKKYNYTGIKEEEKCCKCRGSGFYEVNTGDIGFTRCKCPDCMGTGFSEAINNVLIGGCSIGEVLSLPLKELHLWCENNDLFNITNIVEPYVAVGLSNVRLNEHIGDLSLNEKILFDIVYLIVSGTEKEIVVRDFSANISASEYAEILTRLDSLARKENKRIVIAKG